MAKQTNIDKIDPDELKRMQDLVAKIQGSKSEIEKKRNSMDRRQAKEANPAPRPVPARVTEGKATHLFVDDNRGPDDVTWVELPENQTWHVVRSFDDFKNYITTNELPKFISFDSDLGPKSTGSGESCAKWLVTHCIENKLKLPNWSAHAVTISGRAKVENVLLLAKI